jgi:membrane associated rhomboid family serine protease
MWAISGILAAAGVIFIIEAPALLKRRSIKELWIFSILLVVGTVLSILLSLQVNLPHHLDWITAIYRPFSDLMKNTLE